MESPNRPIPQPITPEAKPYWDGLKEGKLMLPQVRRLRQAFLLSARALPVLPFASYQLDAGQRQGQALLL